MLDTKDNIKAKVQDVAAGASVLAGKAKDTAQEWASSVGSAAMQARDRTAELTSAAVSKARDLGKDLTTLIRRHPLQALLVGVGVGFGAGFLAAQLLRRS
jgi:ElaB/YqjD/DUF883 family membrane-anchored ribosome-binding protein